MLFADLNEPMDYNHEAACALYAAAQERARILEIIRAMDGVVIFKDALIQAIEA